MRVRKDSLKSLKAPTTEQSSVPGLGDDRTLERT